MEEPELLMEMRVAWGGQTPRTAGDRQAAAWLAEDPKGFRNKFTQLQSDWASRSKASPDAGVVQERDYTTEMLVERIRRLISEAKSP